MRSSTLNNEPAACEQFSGSTSLVFSVRPSYWSERILTLSLDCTCRYSTWVKCEMYMDSWMTGEELRVELGWS